MSDIQSLIRKMMTVAGIMLAIGFILMNFNTGSSIIELRNHSLTSPYFILDAGPYQWTIFLFTLGSIGTSFFIPARLSMMNGTLKIFQGLIPVSLVVIHFFYESYSDRVPIAFYLVFAFISVFIVLIPLNLSSLLLNKYGFIGKWQKRITFSTGTILFLASVAALILLMIALIRFQNSMLHSRDDMSAFISFCLIFSFLLGYSILSMTFPVQRIRDVIHPNVYISSLILVLFVFNLTLTNIQMRFIRYSLSEMVNFSKEYLFNACWVGGFLLLATSGFFSLMTIKNTETNNKTHNINETE